MDYGMRHLILISLIISCFASAKSIEIEQNEGNTLPHPLVVLSAAIQGGSPGTEFNENYSWLTFRQFNTYSNETYLQAAIKFTLTDEYRIAGFVGYNSITAADRVYSFDEDFQPILDEERYSIGMDFSGIPIGAQFEYLPFQGQFRTFVGVGGGIELGEYSWNHTDLTTSEVRNQNNANLDKSLVSPFIRLNVGTELGFDKEWRTGFFAGISGDITITRYFRSLDAFNGIDPFFAKNYTEEEIAFFPWQVNFGFSLIINALD